MNQDISVPSGWDSLCASMNQDISVPSGWDSLCEDNIFWGNYMLNPCPKCGKVHPTQFFDSPPTDDARERMKEVREEIWNASINK